MTNHDKAEIIRRYKAGASGYLLSVDYHTGWRAIKAILLDAGVVVRGSGPCKSRSESDTKAIYLPTPEDIEREARAIREGLVPSFHGWSEEEQIRRMVTKILPVETPTCRLT